MYLVQCNGCRAMAFTEDATDPDAAVTCAPDSGCCQEDHHHGEAAKACAGDHEHGPDMPGCTVCRPVTIIALPGSVTAQQASGETA